MVAMGCRKESSINMIFIEAMKKIQELTDIPYHELSPIVFGNDVAWLAPDNYILASQLIPTQTGLLVFRTECYTTNLNAAATDILQPKATPPGFAYWTMASLFSSVPVGNDTDLTDQTNQAHVILDTDCFLLAVAGANPYLNLIGILDATPDGVTRQIRTTCYGFFVPYAVYERLRNQFYWPNMPTT
jgi:hypothetical protein